MYNNEPRINERIRISPVLVVSHDGVNLGSMTTSDAIKLARSNGFDLIEVSPNSRPPVCRIMDYGKFKYEKSLKEKQSKKNTHVNQMKEVRLRPVTAPHDLEVKTKAIRGFIEDGYSVLIKLKFKAREVTHKDIGMELINSIINNTSDIADVKNKPLLQGSVLNCLLTAKLK